jgi:hypothetical protein
MLVIPMYQPYASAAALGLKRVETRPARVHWRGLVAIHSCAAWPRKYSLAYWALPREIRDRLGTSLPFAQIIAVAELAACVPAERFSLNGLVSQEDSGRIVTVEMTNQERCLGDYASGRFGWVLENVRLLPGPVPYKAHQGCYQLPSDIESAVIQGLSGGDKRGL